jgi:ribonucleoside-diphosphate reductase alpha chain
MKVQKRDGEQENYTVEKIHQVLEWATEGVNGVSVSEIEMNANLSLYNGISTSDIHKLLIKSANDLTSKQFPNYQVVAAHLLNMSLRKDVWADAQRPPSLLHHIQVKVDNGVYDPAILDKWSPEEIDSIDSLINHGRDDIFTYAGLQQMIDKYLVKNRNTGEIYETPQFAYVLIAMCLFSSIQSVKKAYDSYSTFKVNLPTPIMAGVRTNIKQFASCVLVDVDDTLESIFSSIHAVGKYTARRAGIGLNVGRVRPINSSIRGGEVVHTGIIPYLKIFESAVKATSQNGVRGGGGTVYIPWWHYEIEDVLVLKNNAGTDDNRVRKLDYCIQFEKLFYDRLIKDEDITLFSPHEASELYEHFGDNAKFKAAYEKFERKTSLNSKKKIKARKLAEIFARERLETGRIYSMNIDNVNKHGSWTVPVRMSNLCVEITQPTVPIKDINDPDGEIGICMLSAINLLECKSHDETRDACRVAIRSLDSIIDYQDYPVKAGETFTQKRRSLGVGITNFAGLLANKKLFYDNKETLVFVHEMMERIQWNLLNESCLLAEELGACEGFQDTKYAQGQLPIDWYKKTVDELVEPVYHMDWEGLRERIKEHGLRHSTVSAIMPCESSSVIQGSTNGIEPVRDTMSFKKAKNGVLKQLVPFFAKKRNYYTLAWSLENNDAILRISAVLQKFVDMGISTNMYYNYSHFPDGNIPLSVLIKDQMVGYKYGIKNLYYANTPDSDGETEKDMGCDSGACAI